MKAATKKKPKTKTIPFGISVLMYIYTYTHRDIYFFQPSTKIRNPISYHNINKYMYLLND